MAKSSSSKRVYFLVGLPGSGKSTFRNNLTKVHSGRGIQVVSLDDYVEWYADQAKKTYSEVFLEAAKEGERRCHQQFEMSLRRGLPVILDRTNLSKKSRHKWLKDIPEGYQKIAVVMKEIPEEELQERLAKRPDKKIPEDVLINMKKSFEYPTKDEGFDDIYEWPQEVDLDLPPSVI